MSKRDPFPAPKLENDFTLDGFRPQLRKTHNKPSHISQKEEPWSHLHDTATLASTRRNVMYLDYQVPNDSLDFQLKTIYDHHNDAFWSKNQMLCQREIVCEHLRKRAELEMEALEKEREDDIRVWVDPRRTSVHSIK
ncbi:protein C1orf194 homolog [Kryptolebias marmoratus]|uniref:Uncharacterized protein n=1 Tax=Kryptolebias marmoratus TaxID=37003 RepID=A0A3Q3A0E0_KRYMA|nr:protein C1orf194 homolog [Kryptolebias marmoratus]